MKSKTNKSLLIYKKIIKLHTEELSAKNDSIKTNALICFSRLHRLFKVKTFKIVIWPRQARCFRLSQNKSKQVIEEGIND